MGNREHNIIVGNIISDGIRRTTSPIKKSYCLKRVLVLIVHNNKTLIVVPLLYLFSHFTHLRIFN